MSQVHICRAVASDLSFIAASQVALAHESENLALDAATVHTGVRGVLERPDRGFHLLARVDDAPRGCMLVLSEWSDWRAREVWWLHSVYVEPAFRRHGIFRALFEHVKSLAREANVAGLRLYVDRRNTNAQAVYRALGMSNEHYELFELML